MNFNNKQKRSRATSDRDDRPDCSVALFLLVTKHDNDLYLPMLFHATFTVTNRSPNRERESESEREREREREKEKERLRKYANVLEA